MISALVTTVLRALRQHKLSQDIAYSMGSFVMLAISGIVINVVVTACRDAAALGAFNLAYAVYIVMSQFAVWGIQYSVLRHSAFHKDSPVERGTMLCTAACMVTALGAVATLVLLLAEPLFARLFNSVQTGQAIHYAAFGLLLFPLNKVLLAYLNGLRAMRAFSVLQGLRYLMVMVTVCAVALSSWPIERAALAFIVAESVTVLACAAYLIHTGPVSTWTPSRQWVCTHFRFGTKGLLSGMFTEVNSRIDVLLIGLFLSDRATGIYSFAAMLVDGLYQVLAMVRINFNPMLVAFVRDGHWEQAQQLRRLAGRYVVPLTLVLSALLVLTYWAFTLWVMPGKGLAEGLASLLILLAGLNLIAMFVPFDNLMIVSGHPGLQATQQMASVVANALASAILLPLIGIEGAAIGTAVSYVTGIAVMMFFAERLLGWRLFANTMSSRFTNKP